ncbi:16S rRNA methyltransferase [Gordoniibacillus kamchatkensis]|uniref:Ribosomal RNA small subunit methyltransferase E n=1 Tax=Gordoniibacillus kamchatkensis TaxID=1590651 RepID=A0ABR5ABD2_9BACL|nr:RsmE family RNA methyltransferase [Paenibacillus sp. VKM B-2647]KIL38286.1 16S rRNA methyltransferase [Paenibacillus sp. VKM B-2647]
MQRYFVASEQWVGSDVTIAGDDAHHLLRVMRAEVGDVVIASDGQGREAKVELVALDKSAARGTVREWLPLEAEPAVDVWIGQSLPKGDKMETVIQKGTELGAARFVPFLSERTVVQYDAKKEAKRAERWHKIAKEAAEQAHRNRIPAVDGVRTWKELLQLVREADAAWLCYEKEGGYGLKDALQAWKAEAAAAASRGGAAKAATGGGDAPEAASGGSGSGVSAAVPNASARGAAGPSEAGAKPKLLLLVGPEGGFSEKEALEAEAAGCRPVGLGKRILRTETAAMVGLACILYETGEMGGS